MFVKGGQISETGAKFPRKYGPRGGAIFPRKFGPGGPYFGGAKFPGTPVEIAFFHRWEFIENLLKFNPIWELNYQIN